MLHRSFLCQLFFVVTILCLPLYAFGAPSFAVSSSDGSTFTVSASGVKGMSAVEFSVSYDSSLSQPSVVQGDAVAGALWAVNTGINPIKGAAIASAPFAKDGTVATFTFRRLASSGTVSVSGRALTTDNRYIPMTGSSFTSQSTDNNPGLTGNQTSGTTDGNTTGTASGNTGGNNNSGNNWVGGSLTMPGDVQAPTQVKKAQVESPEGPVTQEPPLQLDQPGTPPVDEPQQPVEGTPAEEGAAPENPADGAVVIDGAQPQVKFVQHEVTSVAERFRVFQGERTPQQLAQFFQRGNLAFFTQTPAIGISDGSSTVTVTIRGVSGEDAPVFALQGARSVKVTKGVAAGEWQVQARPEKGAVRATIVMMADGVKQELPLTVAPPARVDLIRPGVVSEDDFRLFLKQRGTEQAPLYDLNGDGKRDYIDDYIFTANYLARGGIVSEQVAVPAQKQEAVQQGASQQKDTASQQRPQQQPPPQPRQPKKGAAGTK